MNLLMSAAWCLAFCCVDYWLGHGAAAAAFVAYSVGFLLGCRDGWKHAMENVQAAVNEGALR